MPKYAVTAYTVKAFTVEVEAPNEDKAIEIAGEIDCNDPQWKENYNAGGGWEIPDGACLLAPNQPKE